MNKYPSERLFCLTIVLTVDEKWFTARIKPPQVRIIPVDDGMSEDTGGLYCMHRRRCHRSLSRCYDEDELKVNAYWS